MLRKVDDDSLARPGRQDMTARNHQHLAAAGQPRVDAGINPNQFFGAQAVRPREIVERILINRHDGLILANHGIVGARERIFRGVRLPARGKREQSGQYRRDRTEPDVVRQMQGFLHSLA